MNWNGRDGQKYGSKSGKEITNDIVIAISISDSESAELFFSSLHISYLGGVRAGTLPCFCFSVLRNLLISTERLSDTREQNLLIRAAKYD